MTPVVVTGPPRGFDWGTETWYEYWYEVCEPDPPPPDPPPPDPPPPEPPPPPPPPDPVYGCADPGATNYNPGATANDGSCQYPPPPPPPPVYGCADPSATNYNPGVTADDGSCQYPPPPPPPGEPSGGTSCAASFSLIAQSVDAVRLSVATASACGWFAVVDTPGAWADPPAGTGPAEVMVHLPPGETFASLSEPVSGTLDLCNSLWCRIIIGIIIRPPTPGGGSAFPKVEILEADVANNSIRIRLSGGDGIKWGHGRC